MNDAFMTLIPKVLNRSRLCNLGWLAFVMPPTSWLPNVLWTVWNKSYPNSSHHCNQALTLIGK